MASQNTGVYSRDSSSAVDYLTYVPYVEELHASLLTLPSCMLRTHVDGMRHALAHHLQAASEPRVSYLSH
jgi:hypothetical protein